MHILLKILFSSNFVLILIEQFDDMSFYELVSLMANIQWKIGHNKIIAKLIKDQIAPSSFGTKSTNL